MYKSSTFRIISLIALSATWIACAHFLSCHRWTDGGHRTPTSASVPATDEGPQAGAPGTVLAGWQCFSETSAKLLEPKEMPNYTSTNRAVNSHTGEGLFPFLTVLLNFQGLERWLRFIGLQIFTCNKTTFGFKQTQLNFFSGIFYKKRLQPYFFQVGNLEYI